MMKPLDSNENTEPKYQLTAYERETNINFNQEEATATVYTHNNSLKKKLALMAKENPTACTLEESNEFGGMTFRVPKTYIKVSAPRKIQLTEEQRQAIGERLKKMRSK